ncbi:MAG: Rho termination factor N-terminal domain-containing protein [Anaerolineaceae bacterium]|nr:Rho termination factor N-terminal domain-containing protein [Anaerolineaceae bacterium]
MQIEMLKATAWDHVFYEKGDGPKKTDKLPEDVKQRWVNRKIAIRVDVPKITPATEDDDLDALKVNELKVIAEELGIEVNSKMKKAELIEAIRGSEAG